VLAYEAIMTWWKAKIGDQFDASTTPVTDDVFKSRFGTCLVWSISSRWP